jgi:hypothetical protein
MRWRDAEIPALLLLSGFRLDGRRIVWQLQWVVGTRDAADLEPLSYNCCFKAAHTHHHMTRAGERSEFTPKMTAGCALALLGFAWYSHARLAQREAEQRRRQSGAE